jgi:hypothetical protein
MSGEEVQLLDDSIRDIFRFAGLGKNDTFYHLGCGSASGLEIALKEFSAKKAVGIEKNALKASDARRYIREKNLSAELRHEDIIDSDLSDATMVLFWFSDISITEKMYPKFLKLKPRCKIITIFDPLPRTLPQKVSFPYLLHETPLKSATLKEQVMRIFDTECIDFTTAWEYAERYTKAVGSPEAGNDRFLTILQAITIWINARNLGLSCTEEVPAPVKAYIEILQNFFNIEVKHLVNHQRTSP